VLDSSCVSPIQEGHVNHSNDEFEDVPSPFRKTTTRSKMFARPLGTVPSEAPVLPLREQPDFVAPKRRAVSVPQVEYLDDIEDEDDDVEEDEVVENRPAKPRTKPKVKAKSKANLLPRIGWAIVGFLLLRLVFMERGVVQYWQMSGTIGEHEQELLRVRKENAAIASEIKRIEFDKGYQRFLAKEHLGVIAADEFLILFAGEDSGTQSGADRRL
jgi:cell division protein FtsB